MTVSVYGHGSWFAGIEDASDVDVMVVTDEPMSIGEAARYVLATVDREVLGSGRLPLDVHVTDIAGMHLLHRELCRTGRLLAGRDLLAGLPAARPFQLAATFLSLARQHASPAAAALAAIRAVWAAEGRVVVPRSRVVEEARGGAWQALAAAAWPHRHAGTFAHPDLNGVLSLASAVGPGEAIEGDEVVGRVFRRVLTSRELRRLSSLRTTATCPGGRTKGMAPAEFTNVLYDAACIALHELGLECAGIEAPEVHRYRTGDEFPGHVDCTPDYPTRALNVVAMVRPAASGGELFVGARRVGVVAPGAQVDFNPATALRPRLEPGDIAVFDSGTVHGVTPVESGNRVVLVTHAHRTVGRGTDR